MSNKSLASLLTQARDKGFTDGVMQGIWFGFQITSIVLHNSYGFGQGRILKTRDGVKEILNEVYHDGDPVWSKSKIERALAQINRR